jgi:hypothetical protein
MSDWRDKLKEFCANYDLCINYIVEILEDPKVIPMIRGKSFEFSVFERFKSILSSDSYEVEVPFMNSQTGFHDIDVLITRKVDEKKFRIECKLSKKGSFSFPKDKQPLIRVKCMRSRTLGEEAAKQKSKLTGKDYKSFMVHNDQYIVSDFDLVVTSLGNAFYQTNDKGLFEWDPSPSGRKFLESMGVSNQQEAFNKLYIARSIDLLSNIENSIECTRKKCSDKNCNFIPNYPFIYFDKTTLKPTHPWHEVEEIESLLRN